MSLLNASPNAGVLEREMKDCTRLERVEIGRDGQGGSIERYEPGAAFKAYLFKQTASDIQVAERRSLNRQNIVIVPRQTALQFGDVFRRDSDGATFRVTGATADTESPDSSPVQIAKTTAELWEVPE